MGSSLIPATLEAPLASRKVNVAPPSCPKLCWSRAGSHPQEQMLSTDRSQVRVLAQMVETSHYGSTGIGATHTLTKEGSEPTTSLLPSATELAGWVAERRKRLLDLVGDLSDSQLVGPRIPTINPLDWEIGHVGWFQERFALREVLGEKPIIEYCDAIWDSAEVPHDTRWFLRLPNRKETQAYLRETAAKVIQALRDPEATELFKYIVRYATHHEDWHCEAILYTRQTLALPAPQLGSPSPKEPTTAQLGSSIAKVAHEDPHESAYAGIRGQTDAQNKLEAADITSDPLVGSLSGGDAHIPGGKFILGANRDAPFVFDNEKWAHEIDVVPFNMARTPVTEFQFAEFVEAGGYFRPELWSEQGWAWRKAAQADSPVYWRRGPNGWQRRHFNSWVDLDPYRPAMHVNFFEAEAYCNWADRRLPTEAEWEAAAVGQLGPDETLSLQRRKWPWGDEPPDPTRANLDAINMDSVDVRACRRGDSAFGVRQLIGNLWEWTSSVFEPYPGFEPDIYSQNSQPWFGTRRVLRGGSWATRSELIRPTLRNYFTPDRRDVYAGLRTVALD